MEPNTKLTLEELTDEHLEKVIDFFRSSGLDWYGEIPLAHEVKEELESRNGTEFRSTIAIDISKLIVDKRHSYQDDQDYLHFSISYGQDANAPENADKSFDKKIRGEFL